jgi:hypothetical protein
MEEPADKGTGGLEGDVDGSEAGGERRKRRLD